MSDDDDRITRIGELLDALNDPALSDEQRAQFERELSRLGEVLPEGVRRVIEHQLFADELKVRQGTIPPDFAAIYRRKAELDRRTSEDSPPPA
jgi:hypothetical protein